MSGQQAEHLINCLIKEDRDSSIKDYLSIMNEVRPIEISAHLEEMELEYDNHDPLRLHNR